MSSRLRQVCVNGLEMRVGVARRGKGHLRRGKVEALMLRNARHALCVAAVDMLSGT